MFTINLKTKKLDVNSAKHGDGGYSYFIDKAEATTVVASMLKAFSLPEIGRASCRERVFRAV